MDILRRRALIEDVKYHLFGPKVSAGDRLHVHAAVSMSLDEGSVFSLELVELLERLSVHGRGSGVSSIGVVANVGEWSSWSHGEDLDVDVRSDLGVYLVEGGRG